MSAGATNPPDSAATVQPVRGARPRASLEDPGSLLAMPEVLSKQGQRLEEIGRAIRTDTAVLEKPIANLLKAKKLRPMGRKRGTKYLVKQRGLQGNHVTCPVCVALNVLQASQPPRTFGSR
jgi:hypothetical protein